MKSKRKLIKGESSNRRKKPTTPQKHRRQEHELLIDDTNKVIKITTYLSLEVVGQIKKILDDSSLEAFRNGPFGHFLNFQLSKVPTKFLSYLIRRQCMTYKPNTLAFNFSGEIAEFGIKEFCLITGLRGDEIPNISTSEQSEIKELLFKDDKQITRKDIERTFKSLTVSHNESLKVKVANLYLLECFLIPKQQHNHINWKHIHLVDNLELFATFPWGRVCYNQTFEYFKKASSNLSSAVYLQGFPLALVFWAFEIIPKLSQVDVGFGRKIGNISPRIISWECGEPDDWQTLQENVFEANDFSILQLYPTFEEYESDKFNYFVRLEMKEKEEKERKEKEEKDREERDKKKRKRNEMEEEGIEEEENVFEDNVEEEEAEKRTAKKSITEQIEDLKMGQKRLEEGQQSIIRLLMDIVEEMNIQIPRREQDQHQPEKNTAPSCSLQLIEKQIDEEREGHQFEEEYNEDIDEMVDYAANYASMIQTQELNYSSTQNIPTQNLGTEPETQVLEEEQTQGLEQETEEEEDEAEAIIRENKQKKKISDEEDDQENLRRENKSKKSNDDKGKQPADDKNADDVENAEKDDDIDEDTDADFEMNEKKRDKGKEKAEKVVHGKRGGKQTKYRPKVVEEGGRGKRQKKETQKMKENKEQPKTNKKKKKVEQKEKKEMPQDQTASQTLMDSAPTFSLNISQLESKSQSQS